MYRKYLACLFCLAFLFAGTLPVAAQSTSSTGSPPPPRGDAAADQEPPLTPAPSGEGPGNVVALPIDGPPPAPLPAMISPRDDRGRVTVRAVKLTEPLTLDGVLDEAVYTEYQPFGGLLQVAPNYGSRRPSGPTSGSRTTTRTSTWRAGAGTRRRPTSGSPTSCGATPTQLRNNDHFGVMFDTFYDRRSGFMFYTNPLGALADYSVVDEGGSNTDWNPVWTSRTGRFDGGWTVEMAIPFKTLRYRSGTNQVWGIQLRRAIRRKNEWAYLTPVPQNLAGPQALNRVSAAGTLVGLDLPPAGKNIELKPYALSRVDDRPSADAAAVERRHRRRHRRRLQVRRHRQPHCRLHRTTPTSRRSRSTSSRST